MNITYDTIIEHLFINQQDTNTIITEKNNYGNISNIFNIFNNNYCCYGITSYDNDNNNISMYSSILTLLDIDFILPLHKDELNIINNFKNNIINYNINNNIEFDKLNLNDSLQVISNIFNINFILFEKSNKNIIIICSNNIYNPYKNTLLLSTNKLLVEPIINHNIFQRQFTYNDNIIKTIININNISNINYNNNDTNITNSILYINIYNINFCIIEQPIIEQPITDQSNKKQYMIKLNLNKTKLNLMKIIDLKKLAHDLEINITNTDNKFLLKKDIIIKIYNIISE